MKYAILVYRPEVGDDFDGLHKHEPFAGVELYGTYSDAKEATEALEKIFNEHPGWQYHLQGIPPSGDLAE